MTWITTTDPLALVAIQAGQVNNPSEQTGADGGGRLDTQQRAVLLGEPVPIVFARRRDGNGGVLISPSATEARFENSLINEVTAYYHLVLSEGQIDSIPVKDVFQRSCRVGSHSQTYNRRAGTWTPGNAIVQRSGYDFPECPYYCGTVGAYPGMSTLSFQVTIPDGFDQWNRQVHCFIRGGMHVTRLVDSVLGPSDNFADLVNWMLVNSERVPTALIDATALGVAAGFLEANGFTCNVWLTEALNYSDLLAQWAPYFLLGESNNAGKKGLRALLPINNDGTIKTTAITPEYTFTEDTILPGTFELQYTSLADRQPFVVQVTWRQQLEDDFGIIRTAELRYEGTATDGPYEGHDLSAFCTNEDHAVKIGAYILAKRVYTTHTVRFSARPQTHNTIISPGDIVRVRLLRQATTAGQTHHDYLYQVERISKTLAGDVLYECTHFPVDNQSRSLVALDIDAATGTGIVLSSNKTGVGCDINSDDDNTIPAETFTDPDLSVLNAGEPISIDFRYESALGSVASNADDGLDETEALSVGTGPAGAAGGSEITAVIPCSGGTIQWKRNGANISGATSTTYTTDENDIGESITYEVTCPDGSTRQSEAVTPYSAKFKFNSFTPTPISVTIHYRYGLTGVDTDCNTGVTTPFQIPGSGTLSASGFSFSMHTVDQVLGLPLSASIGYSVGCGNGGIDLNVNGALYADTNATSIWGSNRTTASSISYAQKHATIITKIVLNQNVPGLGITGDDVTDSGLEWIYSGYDPEAQTYIKDTGTEINIP